MGKGKLAKFAENETFACLVQPQISGEDYGTLSADHPLKGHWDKFFESLGGKGQDIILELGCGKGEYTIDLSARYPESNCVGVDIKGARLWKGAKTASEQHLPNVAFLRTRIELISSYFAPGEVSEIWLTFSDPQPKKPMKRLSSPAFLDLYRKFLKPGGTIHLKTDSPLLHEYTLEVVKEQGLELLASTADLYGGIHNGGAVIPEKDGPLLSQRALYEVQTHYEKMFLEKGMPITYLAFKL